MSILPQGLIEACYFSRFVVIELRCHWISDLSAPTLSPCCLALSSEISLYSTILNLKLFLQNLARLFHLLVREVDAWMNYLSFSWYYRN